MSGAFERGHGDCVQDSFENAPFSTVGGLTARHAPVIPDYVPAEDRGEWLRGYLNAAFALYGETWQTCEFGWRYALTVDGEA